MATLHKLTIQSNRKVSEFPVGHSAEILIFTGVRYERWTEAKAAPTKSKRKRRSRNKVEAVSVAQ